MIDIHSHIIPGIDDGSKNMEMTIEMLKHAERCGTKEIIATPHYLMEYGEATITEVKEHVKKINEIIKKENMQIKVYSGQEVYFTENIIEDYVKGNIGTLNDSRYMLIEFDMRHFDNNIFDYIYELQVKGITPVIAHPERYKYFIKEPEKINKLINEGYLFQLNSGSIAGKFGEDVKKTAQLFLKNSIYNFAGSDAHNTNTSRDADMLSGLQYLGVENIQKFNIDSNKLINNQKIEFKGNYIKTKKNIFSFFRKNKLFNINKTT